jgi:hypothetical protein
VKAKTGIGGGDALQIPSEGACKLLKLGGLHQAFFSPFNEDFREEVIERKKRR